MKKYYVYAHSNKEYGTFYVGKGCDKRLFTTGNRSAFWKRIVAKYGFEASIIEDCETEELAYEREIFWISHFKSKGQCQANFSLGGDGVRVDKRWWGDQISKSLKGRPGKKGIDSPSFIDFADMEILSHLYLSKMESVTEIANYFGVSPTTVWERLKSYGIPIRSAKERGKPIFCEETGIEYETISDAAKQTGLFRENIRKVLNGKYKHTGGLTFKYKESK